MKRIFLLLCIITVCQRISLAQAVKYKEVKNGDLAYVLNNIVKTTRFTDDKNNLFIRVYVIADPSGSAHTEGTDEITNSIYIAVSDDGEAPEQHLFRLASVYDPKLLNWSKTALGPELIMTYGSANKKKKAAIRVGLKQLVIH
jgi:hypothetical protein